MKKVVLFRNFLLLIVIAAMVYSCAKDTTTGQDISRSSLTGTWSVNETWHKLNYEVTISLDPTTENGVYLDNFAAAGKGVKTRATLSGSTLLIDPTPQTLSTGWVIESGSGNVQGSSKITWSYVFDDQATQYHAEATYTKK